MREGGAQAAKLKTVPDDNTGRRAAIEKFSQAYESSALDRKISINDVDDLFKFVLRRPAGNHQYIRDVADRGYDVRTYLNELMESDEYAKLSKNRLAAIEARKGRHALGDPIIYRAPDALQVQDSGVGKILAIGSCFLEYPLDLIKSAVPNLQADLYLISTDLPEAPASPIGDYQFQIVQVGLRFVLPDFAFARLGQADPVGHQHLLDHAVAQTRRILDAAMKWNRESGILSFVLPFPVPQQNPIGRLMPRYDLRNPVYFVEKLNEAYYNIIAEYDQAYLLDINSISASLGRRWTSEDSVMAFNHGGLLSDFDYAHDLQRIEQPLRVSDIYNADVEIFAKAMWREAIAMYRSVKQIDAVKLVVIDLDDTLWRGVIAESDAGELPTREGWPLGFWEALLILKRRGVLLGIISKNEEDRVREMWVHILMGHSLNLEDFAVTRINWRSKSENMAEILEAVNLLPANVLFIDDNPAQREDIKRAFPDIRVMGGTPSTWRHILLWAAETQQATITDESSARTAMVQAQVEREEQRKSLSNEDFLKSLDVRQTFFKINDTSHPRFKRVMELINKTNQFNTTGKRWTFEECATAFAQGACFYAFDLADRFTEYGLVGILIADRGSISQFVMSCRIMGLDAELNAVAFVARVLAEEGAQEVVARLVATDRNLPCRNVYARAGFVARGDDWVCDAAALPTAPAHIAWTA